MIIEGLEDAPARFIACCHAAHGHHHRPGQDNFSSPKKVSLTSCCFFVQNVVIFSLVPDYTMFGSQHYNQVQQINIFFAVIILCPNLSMSSLCRFRTSLVKVISLMLNNLTTRAMALAGVLFAVGHRQCPQQRYKLSWKRKYDLFFSQSLQGPLCAISNIRLAPGFPRPHLGLWSSLLLVDLGPSW